MVTLSASVALGIKVTERRKPQAETQYHEQQRIPAIDALRDGLMTNVTRGMVRRRRREESAQSMVEYALLLALISVAAIGALTAQAQATLAAPTRICGFEPPREKKRDAKNASGTRMQGTPRRNGPTRQ